MSASVKNLSEIPVEKLGAGKSTYRQVLIGPAEGPNFAMRRFIMEPGGGIPSHTNTVEHEQFVLRGRARIGIGDAVYEVKPDDVLFIPAGVPHWYEVLGDENFEFLCMVPNQDDKISLIEKKK
ncbi:MAG: cupin domain-containing protein [Deltaproteobacteria bacterium]